MPRLLPQPWFQRDTPVGMDMVVENLMDPVRASLLS